MAFRNELHKKFDKYVANPFGAATTGLGSLALGVVGLYEGLAVLYGDQQMTFGEVAEPIGYLTAAAAAGIVAVQAVHHGISPNHIPPQG